MSKVARAARVRPQTARRWFLDPAHADRRAIRSDKVKSLLADRFDLQPGDFVWLRGERAARREAASLVREAA